jgi:hypothetical protein
MKTPGVSGAVSILVALASLLQVSHAQQHSNRENERIGIYDSRAIAVAYVGSTFQQAKMKGLKDQLAQAKKVDDTNAVARLTAEGQAWQSALNQQGFGTASVDDLLAHIAHELPRIEQDTGVTRLISKWNKTELKKHRAAERIDVTMELVDTFHPMPSQRERAVEIQQKSPVRVKE